MNIEISFKTFCWAVIVGAGFRLGWGIIGLLFEMLAKATGHA